MAGVKLGRPIGPGKSKLDQYRPEIEALLLHGSSQKYIAERYLITETTLSNWIKKNGIKKYKRVA
jgi:DNA invertase Pin-like site-specific DNA recombinase